ncbi:MAG: flagellar hook-basal body complex protein FliE [Candidatus Eremiobacteraeota bacterium]|nr:flagellar hook-basal body complex protein FliE [Candidatus Eremiobacteraeota bacterium]
MDINTNYNAAMSSVISGTFVPDIGAAAPDTQPLDDSSGIAGAAGSSGTQSFRDTVKSMLADVNDKVTSSDQLSQDLATGKTTDVNKVVTSVEEANLAMQFTLSVRNKLLEAYQQVSAMQV